MLNIENYVGRPSLNKSTDAWELDLDPGIALNLENICELTLTIFDAQFCRIFCQYADMQVLVAQNGELNTALAAQISLLDLQRDNGESSDLISSVTRGQSLLGTGISRVVSPVMLPSGLSFGYLEFFRSKGVQLTAKEQAVMTVLQRDITNHIVQHKYILQAAKSRELHLLISKHNHDWIFVKDTDFKMVYANEPFMSIFPKGLRDKIIGFTATEGFDEGEANQFFEQDKIAFEKGECVVTEDIYNSDGSRMVFETIKRRFEDENGKPYILCIRRDVTERENLIRQLKVANSDLDDFTNIASHDLKSPLIAIRRLLGWIAEDCQDILPSESLENLHLVVNRADRMHSLLEDLLSFARIGRVDTPAVSLELSKLVEDITPLLDVPEQFTITVEPAELVVPSVPFKTIILNLVGNAIKHNDKEKGLVKVSCQTSQHYYEIHITDNGPGIAPKYFERVFQLFQTLKSRDELEGSGVGLAVVMKHLNQFGGKIEIDSDGIEGTTFKVFWPKPKQ